jgi:hypothetical protein
MADIVRQVLRDADTGIDPDHCEVRVHFNYPSIRISK